MQLIHLFVYCTNLIYSIILLKLIGRYIGIGTLKSCTTDKPNDIILKIISTHR